MNKQLRRDAQRDRFGIQTRHNLTSDDGHMEEWNCVRKLGGFVANVTRIMWGLIWAVPSNFGEVASGVEAIAADADSPAGEVDRATQRLKARVLPHLISRLAPGADTSGSDRVSHSYEGAAALLIGR